MAGDVSIVIPTRNAGPEFAQLLEKIRGQKSQVQPEIVVIDSGSSDGTPETARRYGAKVIPIAPETFDHGLTRNRGIQESQGVICVLLVQDALPVLDEWLTALLRHFDRDPGIAGITTRQFPRPDADVVARWEVEFHNKLLGQEAKIRSIPDWEEFLRLPQQDRFFQCNFDNVCSVVRRTVWEKHPFRSIPFAEDLDWAVRVLREGYKIVYEPDAAVIHSHTRAAIYHLRRQYVSAKVVPGILQCPIPNLFAFTDEEVFAAVNFLVQESFSWVLLVSQLPGDLPRSTWREWVQYADGRGMDDAGGRQKSFRYLIHTRLREFGRRLRLPKALKSSVKSILQEGLKTASPRESLMRKHFYFLLGETVQNVAELNPSILRHVVVHCLGRTLGGFLGSYYLWCKQHEQVSPALRSLDHCLSTGV